ncbi:TIM barrel protein [Amycolatopsis sp. NPDC051045]|uniref:sugar phosphate isomerase/epimerase family protein n=1 Tax=Amycolatopsis sp. NPDC051045 TaxID=3156922 RepID=UPI003449EF07
MFRRDHQHVFVSMVGYGDRCHCGTGRERVLDVRSHESLGDLIPLAKQAGTRLLLENTPYCFTPTVQDLAGIVSTVNDDALKTVYDVANAAYIEEDPVVGLLSYQESIATCGVSNVVLEVIREENTLHEFNQAMRNLGNKG